MKPQPRVWIVEMLVGDNEWSPCAAAARVRSESGNEETGED